MLNVIDEFTRECLAIRIDRKLNSTAVIDVLSDLFMLRGVPGHVGPAPVLFRSRAHVRRPFVRRPLVISSRGLNVSGAGCRSR